MMLTPIVILLFMLTAIPQTLGSEQKPGLSLLQVRVVRILSAQLKVSTVCTTHRRKPQQLGVAR